MKKIKSECKWLLPRKKKLSEFYSNFIFLVKLTELRGRSGRFHLILADEKWVCIRSCQRGTPK